MKVLWAAIALFAFVQAKSYQGGWGNNYGRGNNPGRGPPWVQQNYPDVDVEWVCHSQKTSDMMIIVADNTQRQHPGRGPWWQWQNVPPGHQKGSNWTPIFVIEQESTKTGVGQTPSPNTSPETYTNANNQPQTTTPKYHGGEGLIDIRVGE